MVANQGLEIEIAMGAPPVPISVSSPCFALRYEVPKFLPRGGHLCMAVLTITAVARKEARARARLGKLLMRAIYRYSGQWPPVGILYGPVAVPTNCPYRFW